MKVNLTYTGNDTYEVINEDGNVLSIDTLPVGEKKAFSPVQIVMAALASCLSADLVHVFRKRKQAIKHLSAHIQGERAKETPHKFISLSLHYTLESSEITQQEAEKYLNLSIEKYCSVAASLHHAIKRTYSIEVVLPTT